MDIIFDIDGTLMNIQHRVHHLHKTPPDWNSFNNSMSGDTPIKEMAKLLNILETDDENRIIFCSGRKEKYKETTLNQIKNLLSDKASKKLNIYMRKNNDFREDYLVKSDLYDEMRNDGFEPVIVFDDRTSVVKMWRQKGLRCLQVAEGNF